MKLLQNSWSDMLVLDHLHHRIHNNLPDETPLHNGQKFDLLGLGLLGVPQLADHFNEIQNKLQELKFDVGDYICIKFLLLLNPGNERESEKKKKTRTKERNWLPTLERHTRQSTLIRISTTSIDTRAPLLRCALFSLGQNGGAFLPQFRFFSSFVSSRRVAYVSNRYPF